VGITRFDWIDTKKVDGSENLFLKRHMEDYQFILAFKTKSWFHRKVFYPLWKITSDCGRSLLIWTWWSAVIAAIFAVIYWWRFGCERIAFNVDQLRGIQPDFLDYLYYSVVTFTTLGFGDIVPRDKGARLVVGAEVILGYIMLGGLISIFANKLARRA